MILSIHISGAHRFPALSLLTAACAAGRKARSPRRGGVVCDLAAVGVLALMAVVAADASATNVLYNQTFDTDCSAADFTATYPGFSSNGSLVWSVTGGYAQDGANNLYRQNQELGSPGYVCDWSYPLTISADLASTGYGNGKISSVFLAPTTGTGGIVYAIFGSYGNLVAVGPSNNGQYGAPNPRNVYGCSGNTNQAASVPAAGTFFNMSLTIRQNAGDTNKFDWLAQFNGVDQLGGWHTGIAKSNYFNSALTTFGVGYEEVNKRVGTLALTLQNPTAASGTVLLVR